MDEKPLITRQMGLLAGSLEDHVDLHANDFDLSLDLVRLLAWHFVEDFVENASMIVSGELSLHTLLF